MKIVLFISLTIVFAYCRFLMPLGGPDLLSIWLITLAFYTENKYGLIQAFWIGCLHSFPSCDPWVPMICILAFIILQKQRFHLGRDCFLPRFLTIVSFTALLDFLEWYQLSVDMRPDIYSSFELIGIHAAITACFGIPILSFGQNLEHVLGFRQERYDF